MGERPLPPASVVRRMVSSIAYRGPDGGGEYLGEDVHLGVVRLAIIDIKEGHQPVSGCDDRTLAVYNGEIYNYQELRRDLRARGHTFPNECDSTVIPHLYEEKGEDLLQSLRGMFAFALWDARERKLLLARDRLGIKPLYWTQTADYLLFASEVKALFASGLIDAKIDRRSVDDLFSFSYPCPPRTMFRGVQELRPAHFVSVRAGTRMSEAKRYWRAPFPHRGEHRRGSRRDLEAELREALRRRAYDHLQSDVRVGTFLSGGLDSASISALVKEVTGDPPVTFSIGFANPDYDERPFADRMVEELGAENHAVVCDANTAELYPKMIWHTELPLQFPLALPLMQLSGLARSCGFPVILTGEGADELMGGYDCFRAQKMRRVLDRPGLRALRPHVYRQLYKWLSMPEGALEKMLEVQRRPVGDVEAAFSGVYPAWYDNWQVMDVDRDLLLSPDGRPVCPTTEPPPEFAALVREDIGELAPLDAQLAIELETRLPSWILLIGDRASMANGVETRVPFLDHEIVELIARLAPSLKMKGFTEKSVLRQAMKGLLPDDIRKRQKRPFYTPVREWFFSDAAPEYVREVLDERSLREAGLFAPEVVKKLRQDLSLVPQRHLRRLQLEWVLIQVLGTQLMHHLFVAEFQPGRGDELVPGWAPEGAARC
jgi:asparagine synthase (glutamine-hydrolysing)